MTLEDDVSRKIESAWPAAEGRRRARELLATYGREAHEREPARVRLAILKLCDGDLDQLVAIVAAAKRDYRDVLMWAEYPEEGRSLWTARPTLTDGEQARLDEIRAWDRRQYEEWRDT